MNKIYFYLTIVIVFCITSLSSNAQVEFTVDIMPDSLTYQVSLRPTTTWTGSDALTATAQVTLRVPTGGFVPGSLTNMNGTWTLNSPFVAPAENPGFDYITVGLSSLGTSDITYTSGVEEPLFTFQNTGTCTGSVELMEANDPFIGNTLNANVGNQITTFGSGNTNAWTSNYDAGNSNCLRVIMIDTVDLSLTKVANMTVAQIAEEVTYTITVYNDGPDDANGVVVTDALPDGVYYGGNHTASVGTFVDSTWTIGTIAANDSATLEIVVNASDPGIMTNNAEITSANGDDLDSTPGNGDITEDDQDNACFSVPYMLCEGENDTLLLEAPVGFGAYQWYKDGVAIDATAGGTATDLYITEAGEYLLAIENAVLGDCGNQMCCPIVVTLGNCCPEQQCIRMTVTKR